MSGGGGAQVSKCRISVHKATILILIIPSSVFGKYDQALLDSLKIPESNNNGSHSIDGMCLHGFSGSERGGGTVPILQAGWGAHAAGAPPCFCHL